MLLRNVMLVLVGGGGLTMLIGALNGSWTAGLIGLAAFVSGIVITFVFAPRP